MVGLYISMIFSWFFSVVSNSNLAYLKAFTLFIVNYLGIAKHFKVKTAFYADDTAIWYFKSSHLTVMLERKKDKM